MLSTNVEQFLSCYEDLDYCVFDTETKRIDTDYSIYTKTPEFIILEHNRGHSCSYDFKIFVGHNICFDLQVLGIMYYDSLDLENHFIWDTQLAAHLLSGGSSDTAMLSLDKLAERYGLTLRKEETVSEMIKAGVPTEDIPIELLKAYCQQDVEITELVFQFQIEQFKLRSFRLQKLILEQMKYRFVTHTISNEGLYVDTVELSKATDELRSAIEDRREYLVEKMKVLFTFLVSSDETILFEYNPNSVPQLSTAIWGTSIKADVKFQSGLYKNGRPKFGTVQREAFLLYVNRDWLSFIKTNLSTKWYEAHVGKTDEETLVKLFSLRSKTLAFTDNFILIKTILQYRKLNKIMGTYFEPYLDIAKVAGRNTINTQYIHCLTPTGRISSSKPNVQTLPN